MSVNMNDPGRLNGTTVVGGDGEKLGNVDAVYYDNATDRAEWVAVRSGLFGTRVTLVPLRRADYTGDELRVPFDKVQLRNAPHHDPGNELSSTDEADLYRYYGIDYSDTADGFARVADHDAEREPVAGQRTVEGDVRQERIEYDGAELDSAEHDLRDTRF
jgi:PRC-barrel domain protein